MPTPALLRSFRLRSKLRAIALIGVVSAADALSFACGDSDDDALRQAAQAAAASAVAEHQQQAHADAHGQEGPGVARPSPTAPPGLTSP